MADGPLNATVVERHDLHEELSIVKVRPDSGRVPAFEPGQFCTLGLPRGDYDDELLQIGDEDLFDGSGSAGATRKLGGARVDRLNDATPPFSWQNLNPIAGDHR